MGLLDISGKGHPRKLISGHSGCKFFVLPQNHDQVGNRSLGDRLSMLVAFEALKLAAGAVILSLTFRCFSWRGVRRGDSFLYFVSHPIRSW